MTDITADDVAEIPPRRKKLLPLILVVVALIAGGAVGYTGLWSPQAMFAGATKLKAEPAPAAVFLDLPRLVVSLPANPPRNVALTALIDVDPAQIETARQLQPRIIDSFTAFLSDIEPAAFDRRGILDILRAELATRARFILGDKAVNDILITEYRLQ